MSPASTTIVPPSSSSAVTTLPPLPQYSLAPQVFDWCSRYIRQPDGPDAGGAWNFTAEQKRFLFYLYAIDENGRFLWSRSVLRRAKGWGKSPFMAAIALAELCGPVRFGGWRGKVPLGVPVSLPWVQLAGVSEKQVTNTMSMALAMLNESPMIDEYGLDLGLTRVYTANGGKLEPITASAPTAEGARPTFAVLDETHLWKQENGGHKLAEVIRRNLGKSRDGAARSVETTNAHEMGMDSVAERSYDAWQAQLTGKSRGSTILYDSREAPPDIVLEDEESLLRGLAATYGDSYWTDLERIKDEVYDPGTPRSTARQFYLNQLSVAEDAWIAPHEWASCTDKLRVVPLDAWVALGFDGSETDDHSALVLCDIETGHLLTLGVWDPERHGGNAPRDEIDGAVRKAFDDYDIVAFFSDVHPFESYVDAWARDFADGNRTRDGLCVNATPRSPIGWDMRGRVKEFTFGAEAFHQATLDRVLTHDGNERAVQHVYNARRRPNQYGVSFGKEHRESAKKVDWLAAAVLARMARQAYIALPEGRKRRKRTGRAMFV